MVSPLVLVQPLRLMEPFQNSAIDKIQVQTNISVSQDLKGTRRNSEELGGTRGNSGELGGTRRNSEELGGARRNFDL